MASRQNHHERKQREIGRKNVQLLLEDNQNIEMLLDSDDKEDGLEQKQRLQKPNKECNHLEFHEQLMRD